MNATTKLSIIHAICHIALIPAIWYGEWWMFLLSFLWWQIISITAISSGYHRYFSHKSFSTGNWYPWYVQFVALFANPGPVLTWAGAHRMHHAYADTPKDPHSPKYKGLLTVYTSQWGHSAIIERQMLKGLYSTSTKFFYAHYYKLVIALTSSLLLIDPLLLLFMYCIPVVLAFHGYGLINTVTHLDGNPKNVWYTNILTGGEGWHNNHHTDSKNWQIGQESWQLDPGAWFIGMIKK